MATTLRRLGRTAKEAVRSARREARRRQHDARESRRKPPYDRKGFVRQMAIEKEKARRRPGGFG